jgi:hypothetical protein
MEIRNFTNFWNMERKVYSIYDLQLPAPINLRAAGVFMGTAVPYWTILSLVGVPFNFEIIIVWLIVPAIMGFIGNKPIFEGKSFIDYLASRFKFIFESKRYKGVEPATEKYGQKIEVSEFFYTRK